MRTRALVLAAVACGLVAAALLAVVVPAADRSAADAAGDPLAAPTAAAADPARPAHAPAWHQPPLGRGGMLIDGRPRIVRRVADPAGGPDWALRAFPARRTWRDRRGLVVQPPDRCLQLGRLDGGRFGWVDGRNVFRPVGLGQVGAPLQCRPRAWSRWEPSRPERLTRVAGPAGGPVEPLETVAWGFDGRSGRLALRVGGALERETRVEYRVPDPDGGTAWGVPSTATRGRARCLGHLGRVAGRHVGWIDARLGVLRPIAATRDGRACATSPGQEPTRERPLLTIAAVDPGMRAGPGIAARRAARRTLRGRTTIVGIAHPDVVAVTLVTPRDVRTLTPSPREHVFAAVYDGVFPTGGIEVRARMRDGTVRRHPAGPFTP